MDCEESEEYLVLSFKDPIDSKFFLKPNLFFKIVKIEDRSPLIQIGNHVFQGKYEEDSLGTHLLFQEETEAKYTDISSEPSHVNLKFIAKTTKQLTLQIRNLPEDILGISPDELVDLEFEETYEEILEKIEKNALDIKEAIVKPEKDALATEEESIPKATQSKSLCIKARKPIVAKDQEISKINENDLNDKHNLLRKLVQPDAKLPEYSMDIDLDQLSSKKAFKIAKELLLKSIDWSKMKTFLPEAEANLDHYVDLDTSVKEGVVEVKEATNLSDADMGKLISLENWHNLSAQMKITMLLVYLKDEKHTLETMDREMLEEVDQYGLTPKLRYKLLKSIVKDLQYNFFVINR